MRHTPHTSMYIEYLISKYIVVQLNFLDLYLYF